MRNTDTTTINSYINAFPKNIQTMLKQILVTVAKAAPKAVKNFKYGMPTYKLNGKNLVHFAAFKQHTGFYPTPSGITAFQKELEKYKTSKGAIQFPLDESLPLTLIKKIVVSRVKEMNH